jgi:hypothetical protein
MQLLKQLLYTFPFTCRETLFAVKKGANSLNLFHAHLTLVVTAESTPPSASGISAPSYTIIGAIDAVSPKPGNGEGCVRKGIRRKILASALLF